MTILRDYPKYVLRTIYRNTSVPLPNRLTGVMPKMKNSGHALRVNAVIRVIGAISLGAKCVTSISTCVDTPDIPLLLLNEIGSDILRAIFFCDTLGAIKQ